LDARGAQGVHARVYATAASLPKIRGGGVMDSFHEFVRILEGVKEVLIAVTSTASVAVVCAKIVWDKFTRKK
jgi:hypothetical protein